MTDEYLRVLADARRRQILTSLLAESPHSVSSVRSDGGGGDGSEERRRRRRIELRHVHLPKLEQQGLIDWNPESNVVTRGPGFEEIEPVLELIANGHDKPLEEELA